MTAKNPGEAGSEARRPLMTVIIDAVKPTSALSQNVLALRSAFDRRTTEIVVASNTPWDAPPEGVRVVVTGFVSRGDKFDKALEGTHGELVAFLTAGARPGDGWQQRAIELMADDTIGAAGGPQLLPPDASTGQRAAWAVLSSRLGSGPLTYRFKRAAPREVADVTTTNVVVRRSALDAVGGFQSPSPLGDDVRLCYKLRSLLGLRILYDPGLAVEAPPAALSPPFLSSVGQWGRHRGDLSRRLMETTRLFPHAAPAVSLLGGIALALLAIPLPVARLLLAGYVAIYLVAGLAMLARASGFRAGLLAAIGLPLSHWAYGLGFVRGYLGPSLGVSSPGKHRAHPLRILIFNWRDVSHPWSGGAESYMHEMARRWVKAGCDVGWVSARFHGGQRVEVIDGVRIHRLGGPRSLYALAAVSYLMRLRGRYDVIVDCENGIPFFTPLYSRKPVVLVVHHVHAEVFRNELPRYQQWLALWLEGWLMPVVYRERPIVTVSASTQADLVAAGYNPERISIVANGVDVRNTAAAPPRSGTPLLLYLGRLKRYKSVDVLLQAMPHLLARFPDTRLMVVGQGPDRERLERLAWKLGLASSVRFLGYVERSARDRFLASAWVAVYPSAFEGFGVTCLEANAWGTPVVAARVPGLQDAVVDGATGVLVTYGDSEQLGRVLLHLMADEALRHKLGEQGRNWAVRYSWDTSSELFLEKLMLLTGQPVESRAAKSLSA